MQTKLSGICCYISRFAAFPLIAYAAIDTAIIAVSIISAAVKINRNIYAGKLELIIFLMYSPVFFTFILFSHITFAVFVYENVSSRKLLSKNK